MAAPYHYRYRRFTVADDGCRAIWHLGVGIDDDSEVILIFSGRSVFNNFVETIHGGFRPHTAQDTDGLVVH